MHELLSEWYNKAILHSSDLHIIRPIEKNKIEFIRGTLLRYFPAKYSQLKEKQEISLEKLIG
ncbi:hypothetical protein DXN05_17270 [Deminuibacter soli]|uniref:Uncharacterized protein n=1 Tax=Deminuibacter soli TaxID=2291815 RepID=A0A3E1NFU6_9BACT|nr:hypothetical protein DXN05_17270 [Deminuibacter soli]